MRLLTFELAVLVVFVAETAGLTITVDEESSGGARGTPSVYFRRNVTLPVTSSTGTSRTGTSHDDAAVKSDDDRRHDGEERVGTLSQTFKEAASVLAGHIVALYGTNDAVTNFVSRMSKSKIAADGGITNEETIVKELSEFINKEKDQPWSKDHVTASITTKYRDDINGGHNVDLEGLVKALLKLRRESGMTRHADYIHLELVYRFMGSIERTLHNAWLKAEVKPEELVKMMWVDDGAIFLENRPTSQRRDQPFFWCFRPVTTYARLYQEHFPYSGKAIRELDFDIRNKYQILKSQLESKDNRLA